MEYVTKWRAVSSGDVRSMKFDAERGAEAWAFARLREGCEDVRIEDASGKIVVGKDELLRRWKANG